MMNLSQLRVYSPGYQATEWGFDYSEIGDLPTVLAQPTRIAILPVFYNNPKNFAYRPEFDNLDLTPFDLVVFHDIEFRRQTELIEWITTTGVENWLLCVGGLHANETLDPRTVYRPTWSFTFLQWTLPRNHFPLERPFLFDCLCGARREHRDYVMLALEQSGLLNQSIATYRDIFVGGQNGPLTPRLKKAFPESELSWPYVSPNLDPAWEVKEQLDNSISGIAPWEIYNRCYYSILVETLYQGNCYLMAEKIGKCLYARRLFVHFGTAHWLEKLRSFGFQTFSSVLDESYDSMEDDITRWQFAFEQVKWLSKQDPAVLLQKVKPILDHNHARLYAFRQEKFDEMRGMVLAHLK